MTLASWQVQALDVVLSLEKQEVNCDSTTLSRRQRMLLAETTVKDVDVCNIKLWIHIHSAYVPYQTCIIQNI